ncbi:hypothetical protein [Novosphingobium sp.]|uniref:hypothetical protein n=1 Tax=Novosphingobium sp. TaxID=1874826 RepID=UPI00260371B4|nr:hypothetical protein [Novosphingobium sp.]
MKVTAMSRLKSIAFALAVASSLLASSVHAAPCIPSAATNFCHADFNINNITSSTFRNATAQAAGFNGTTGANASAPDSFATGGMSYAIDGTGYGAISIKSLKNITTTLVWTATQAGPFRFDWIASGQSSAGANFYVVINGTQTLLTNTATAAVPKSGTSTFNVGLGQTISFRVVGTTNNALLNSAQLEVSSFKGVPEIDGGILPLGMLLLGVLFIAAKRRDAGEGEAGLFASA